MAANFAVALMVAVAGYLYLFYVVRRRAVRKYIKTARDRPHRLLPQPPSGLLTGTTVIREDVCRSVARRLRYASGAGAQVVVGEAGSGKTTFLRELTSYLADRGAVPVPVSLRGAQPPLSFRELARQQFSASIDAHVRSEDEADRIWRTLCRERSIVVLADGLDEAVLEMSTDHRSDVVRRALNEARYQELPLVATCRSGAVPLGSSYAEVSLPPLGAEQAREYIKGRIAGPELNKKRGRVDEIVRVKGVGDTPFYLNVVAELLKADRLDTVTVHRYQGARQRDHLRMRLLDTFTQALSEGHILPVRPLQANAEEVIKELARVAGAMTFRGVLEITEPALQEACAELPTRADPLLHDLPTLVEDGTRLGLVQTLVGGNETTIRFSHALLQVYFTERLLADDASRPPPVRWLTGKAVLRTLAIRCGLRESRVRTALIERTASSELLRALAIWCNKTDNATRKLVAQELRGRAGRCRDDAALRLVVTGIEILSPLGDAPVRKMFEEDAAQAFKASGQPARLAAIRSLGEIDLPWAYDLLLDQALHGGEYAVRLNAARTFAAGGDTAYQTLRERMLRRGVDHIEARARKGDELAFRNLMVLGWVLPSLCTRMSEGPFADELREQVRALTDLVRHEAQLDLEAAITQGFKLDALADPSRPADQLALDLLREGKTRFWFSRIMLLHALCVRTAGNQHPNPDVVDHFLTTKTRSFEHPFVRETARLCGSAVRLGSWERHVWIDEGEVIAGSIGDLVPAATELVADIAIMLNLVEHGDRSEHLKRLERSGTRRDLPYCMSESGKRAELNKICHIPLCQHQLCPYPEHLGGSTGRGPLSEAFCRQQGSLRSQGLPVRGRLHRHGVRRMSRRASREFWNQMAERGRT